MQVLVTGGGGFIGRSAVARLKAEGHTVEEHAGDVREPIRAATRPDAVVHLAARIGADGPAERAALYETNAVGAANALRLCEQHGAACVLASTSAVYGPSLDGAPLAEDAPIAPASHYAMSKALAESLARAWCAAGAGRAVALRVFNVYGPGQPLPFVVPYLMERLRAGQPVELMTPDGVCDFVSVEDVAGAVAAAVAFAGDGFEVFNVGTGVGTRIDALADLAARTLGVDLRRAQPARREAPRVVVADVSRAAKHLGWRATTRLASGLAALAERKARP